MYSTAMPTYSSPIVARSTTSNMDLNGNNKASYPRATYLDNGQILGVYSDLSPDDIQILTLITSDDNGNSWHLTGTAARKPSASGTLNNPFLLQLPSGRILLAYRNHDVDSSGKFTTYRITLSSSDDRGASWQFLSDAVVAAATPSKNGLWEPFLRRGPDSTVQLYFSHERSDINQDSVLIISRDGGLTWDSERIISGSTQDNSRDGMIGVTSTSTSDGKLIAVFETNTDNGNFFLQSIRSSDNGMTWGNRNLLYAPPPGKNAGAPQITRVGQKLVVSFMTDEDNTIPPGKSWIDAADAKMLVSEDGGTTWAKSLVFPVPSYWPGLLTLKDQTSFLYMADSHGLKSKIITP